MNHFLDASGLTYLWGKIKTAVGQKQDLLVSGVNIKTINGNSILGNGNISIEGGGGEPNVIEAITFNGSEVPVTDKVAAITAVIPDAVTEATVAGWGFTKNTGTYSKPSGGIPKTDLASDVQTSLGLANTALQSFTESDPIFTASAAYGITSSDITNWNSKTSNVGTITGVSMNGTSIATSGVANITSVPASILIGAIPSAVTAATQALNDNSAKIATTAYVDASIAALPEPMIFKGSLGTGGTITSLPTAAVSNTGFTYKVITDGTYASQSAKIGDTFISDGTAWILIPSGDEPSGTVTSITLKANSPISIDNSAAITTSGTRTISHANSGVTAGTYRSVTVNATGHVTAGTNPTTLSGYGITDAKIANGVITLGSNTITPLTSHQSLANYVTLNTAQTITAVKDITTLRVGNSRRWEFISGNASQANEYLTFHSTVGSKYFYIKDNLDNNLLSVFSGDTSNSTSGTIELNGNAASATKLQTARTIWGQPFDGSGDIATSTAATMQLVYFRNVANNGNAGYVGRGGTTSNHITLYADTGNDVNIYSHGAAKMIFKDDVIYTGSPNFGVGTSAPAYKLDVNGSLRATSFNRNGTTYITSGTPDVPVFDGDVMKYITMANFAKVVGEQAQYLNTPDDLQSISPRGLEVHVYNTGTLPSNTPTGSAARGGCIVIGQGSSPKLLIWIDQNRNMWMQASWYGAYSEWVKLVNG